MTKCISILCLIMQAAAYFQDSNMATHTLEIITTPMTLGEGPHWDQDSQSLYFVDIVFATVHRYHPGTKKLYSVKIDGPSVSFVIPIKGRKNQLAIGLGLQLAKLTWDGESATVYKVQTLLTVETKEGNSFNDGKADPSGRLWAGTMGPLIAPGVYVPEKASLYSFLPGPEVRTELVGISVSNGLAWSHDTKQMYYIDSLLVKVQEFDFDITSGEITNRRDVFDFKANDVPGYPDGMTIDTEDKLWVACFNGSQVIRVDPATGKLLTSIPIPAKEVTSVTFGGSKLDEMYVTSANLYPSDETRSKYPQAGSTFRITGLGVKGLPGRATSF